MACQRVNRIRSARIPPTSSETTPATAFNLINASADRWYWSPVRGQTRKRAATFAIWAPLFDVKLADPLVMADAAELVAHDGIGAAAIGRYRHHVLVARKDLDVDVLGLERESV